MQEMWVPSLGQEDPLEEGMAPHSSILACKIPWTEEPGELQSIGSQRVRHYWVTEHNSRTSQTVQWSRLHLQQTLMLGKTEGRRAGNRGWDGWTVSLTQWTWVWASSGRWWRTGKPGMLQSMGLQRVGNDWVTEGQQTERARGRLSHSLFVIQPAKWPIIILKICTSLKASLYVLPIFKGRGIYNTMNYQRKLSLEVILEATYNRKNKE